jgi:hypothetical protein
MWQIEERFFTPGIGKLCLHAVLILAANVSSILLGQDSISRDALLRNEYIPNAVIQIGSDAEKIRLLTSQEAVVEVPHDEFVQYGWSVEPLDQPLVCLRSGTRLSAREIVLDETNCRLESRHWRELTLPTDFVTAILFRPVGIANRYDQQLKHLRNDSDADEIVFSNGDRIAGKVVALENLPGGEVRFSSGASELKFPISRIDAILFATASRPKKIDETNTPAWEIATMDGSVVYCDHWKFDPNEMTLNMGLTDKIQLFSTVTESPATFVTGIRTLSLYQHLSATEHQRFQMDGPIGNEFTFRKNWSVTDNKLRWDARIYENGLGMHANSSIIFPVENGNVCFKSLIAIDKSSHQSGSVRCRVLALSNNDQWQVLKQSDTIRGGDLPMLLTVEMNDVKAVALQVNSADGGSALDRVNWINPILIKNE